ncbi:phenylalanine--tRNA ligase subunit beta [Candidatus Saccharibacteria bacterium]|nr:phenylalanine--tRNA ligase subunit beta [Candidatus Saccharibacteria bacterium]
MIISLNWLKKYVDINIPTNELVELIGARLVEVEEAIDLAPKYEGAVVVKVVSAEKIEGSDHLSLCYVDDGDVVKNVERQKDGTVQVVCGSPNIRGGVQAVWLPPGAIVPETYGKDDQVRMEARKLRGIVSNGMLAGPDELDLGEKTDDVVYIDPSDAKPGDDFAEKFDLNDILLDIENKSLTHRPDCFGVIGFAREVAGILGQPAGDFLLHPDKNNSFKELKFADDVKLKVTIDDPKLCPRYQAVVLDGFNDKPAKYLSEMDVLLAKSGMRSINPIVDVTNYLMLLSGQPLHAFDYDKLLSVGREKEAHIVIRAGKKGEKLELLDGKVATLDPGDIIITSNDVPIALAGAMGGKNTDIDENTKRIVIESATFNLFNLRGTQFRHGIFSEAITRFTKGQPAGLTDPIIHEAIRILTTDHGMKAISQIVDAYPKPVKTVVVQITTEQVNNLLGSEFTMDDIIMTLENVGFKAKLDGDVINVTAPWWRTDIHIPEDIIEEIGRLNGFDDIPAVLPTRVFAPPTPDNLGDLKSKIRQILGEDLANEVLTYSFVSERLLTNVGQDPKNSYKIINSISPELQYVRQQLTPSLLEKVYDNQKDGFSDLVLFEMNQVYLKDQGLTNEKVPKQFDNLALVVTGDYYQAKTLLDRLSDKLKLNFEYKIVKPTRDENYFEPKRSAGIWLGDTQIGIIGEIKSSVKKLIKLDGEISAFELTLTPLVETVDKVAMQKQSQFPKVNRDMTFAVGEDIEYAKLENLIRESLIEQKLWFQLSPVSIFQKEGSKFKNISFKLTFADYEKTLTSDEIAIIIDQITNNAAKQLNAKVI